MRDDTKQSLAAALAAAKQQQQPQPIDNPQPQPQGFFGGMAQGAVRGAMGLGEAAQGLAGEVPEAGAQTYADTMRDKPFFERFTDPSYVGEFLGETAVGTFPTLAGTLAGGLAGAATPIPGGAIGGAALGAGGVQYAQTLGNEFVAARREGLEPEAAWDRAQKQAIVSGALGMLPVPLAVLRPFNGALKNALFQLAVQPAVGTGQQAVENLVAGRDVTQGLPEAFIGEALFEAPGTVAATRAAGAPPLAGTADAQQQPVADDVAAVGATPAPEAEAPPEAAAGDLDAQQMLEPEAAVDDAEVEAAAAAEEPEVTAFDEALAEDTEGDFADALGEPEDFAAAEGDMAAVSDPVELQLTQPTPKGGTTSSRIKQIIHRLTGVYKVSDLEEVDTADALRDSLRIREKETAAAKKEGVQEGKRFGKWETEKAKLQGKEALAKEKAKNRERRLAEQAKREYRKLLAQVAAAPTDSMSPDYQRRLLELQNGYDFSARSKQDVQRIDATRKAAESGVANLPPDLAEAIQRRPVGSLTLGELRSLAAEAQRLRKLGRLKQKLARAKVQKQIERQAAELGGQLSKTGTLGFDRLAQKEIEQQEVGRKMRGGMMLLMRPARLFELMDRFTKNGPWRRMVWRPMSDAHYRAQERMGGTARYLMEGMGQIAKQYGYKSQPDFISRVLDKKTSVAGEPALMGTERIGIALAAVNDRQKLTDGYLKLADGRTIPALTDEQVDAVVASLTPEEKAMAEHLSRRWRDQGPQVQQVYERLTGKRLDLQDNYFPNIGEGGGDDVNADTPESLFKVFFGENTAPTDTVAKSFTEKKQERAQQTLHIDALDVFNRNTRAVDFFLEVAPEINRVKRLLNEPAVQKQVKRLSAQPATGKVFATTLEDWIKRWLQDSGRPEVPQSSSFGDNVIGFVRRNAVPSLLGFRLMTMAKQSISSANAAAEAGYITPILRAQTQVLAAGLNPSKNKIVRQMEAMFPEVKERIIERDIAEFERNVRARAGKRNKLRTAIDRASIEYGLAGIRYVDKLTVTWVAKGVYDTEYARAIRAGRSELAARSWAKERTKQVLEMTQGDARTTALPQLFRDPGELAKTFTMFGNEINQSLNLHMANAQKALGKKISPKEVYTWVLAGTILPAITSAWIDRGFKVWDEEEESSPTLEQFPVSLAQQTVGGVPFVGPLLEAAALTASSGQPSFRSVMEPEFVGMGTGPVKVGRGLLRAAQEVGEYGTWSDSDVLAKAAGEVLFGGMNTFGLPGEAARIAAEGAADIAAGEAGPSALFTSRYQRRAAAGR